MSKKSYQVYHETLGSALEEHIKNVHEHGGIFVDNHEEMYTFFNPVNYQTTGIDHRELLTLKGKSTKKWAHASIYRTYSGRYELTSYIS